MLKTFGEFIKEQSIRAGSGKKPQTRHGETHRREPHIPHPITTRPTMEESWDAAKSFVKRGLLRAVFGRVVGDIIGAKSKKKKVKTTNPPKHKSFQLTPEEFSPSPRRQQQLTALQGNIKHQQLYGKHPYFGTKRNQQDRIMDKIKQRLNKEEAPAVSVAGGAVPSITDPTTNYAAQLKNKSNMLRRKKPQ